MAYTILKSDGTVLTTIPDGTINTTSTSLGLPGRNYAGYGQPVDTNFVHCLENFADDNPPANPLRGQLWYNINNSTMYICPVDGDSNSANWSSLTSTASGAATTFGNVTVTGNIGCNNITVTNNANANAATFAYLTVTANANIADGNLTTANIGTLYTRVITTGGVGTTGNLTGAWTVNGSSSGNALNITSGNLYISNVGGNFGIRSNNYMNLDGTPFNPPGSYSNANVALYLPTFTGNLAGNNLSITSNANIQSVLTVGGNITAPQLISNVATGTAPLVVTSTTVVANLNVAYATSAGSIGNATAGTLLGNVLSTGATANAGLVIGNWTINAGSRLNATYADLAERYAADAVYLPGTVVELGGTHEITAVKHDLSDRVFGVISNTAAYLMNAEAGSDETHPPVAISGRLSVNVIGHVTKGQRLVSAGDGLARGGQPHELTAFNTIGRALEDKHSDGKGVIQAVVIIK